MTGTEPYTERTPRIVEARKLLRRAGRDKAGRFLVEGAQAVREALAHAGVVRELFLTDPAAARNTDLVDQARGNGVRIAPITERAAATLSDTVTPQGVIAVCDLVDRPLETVLTGSPRLVAVLAGVTDPGNAGTVLRVADAAGADAVIFAGDTVDPHNGKCVRATTGSLFHLPIARHRDVDAVLRGCAKAGLRLLAADGAGRAGLEAAEDDQPTAWVFGGEAHGLPEPLLSGMDAVVRIPVYGHAESLNLATAAAVCLYTTARAHHRGP